MIGKGTDCLHMNLRGIYGDEINHTPGFRRLQCLTCDRYLNGPVWLVEARSGEYERYLQDLSDHLRGIHD